MSAMILASFASVYIVLYCAQFLTSKILIAGVFTAAVIYQSLYFRKLYDLSPILLTLTLAFTVGISIISLLLKIEKKRKLEIKELYEKEIKLKNNLAIMRGRMFEQEKSFAMSMMTAGIAHELGNPINHLQGNLYFLENYIISLLSMIDQEQLNKEERINFQKISGDYKSIIDYSKEGFLNTTNVISNIKHLYGRGHKVMEKTNIKELIARTLQFFRTSADHADYIIEVINENDLFANIVAGEYYIVLTNLLNNAAESFDKNQTNENLIKIETSTADEWIEIIITDNGRGIPADDVKNIFDPFFSTKNKDNNLGMGLALCNDIVKADNNKLRITSNINKGTRAILTLRKAGNEK